MTHPRELVTKYLAIDVNRAPWQQPVRSWLGTRERAECVALRNVRRRSQWLAARWMAKQLIRPLVTLTDLRGIEILSRDESGRGARPRIVIDKSPLNWALSISHTDVGVFVAMAATSRMTVGVDLVGAVPENENFDRLWFTTEERAWMNSERSVRAPILWALKEAVYKAAHDGESWHPRDIEIVPRSDEQFACSFRGKPLPLEIELNTIDRQQLAIVCLPRGEQAAQPSHS